MSASLHTENKKILVLANHDIGLYKFRKSLLMELIKRNNQVFISLPGGDYIPNLEEIGCRFIETKIDRRGINPIRDIALLLNYRKIIKKVKPDLVIAYTVKPNIYGGFFCRIAKIPFFANITGLGSAVENGGMLRKLIFTMYKIALKKARVVFFENIGNRDILVDSGVVKAENTQILNGAGIDINEYIPLPFQESQQCRFLFVGRIMKEKGVDELFEAITRLKDKYGDTVILDVVGMFEESYQQQINLLHEKGIIRFHGYQTNVKAFYEAAHCIVLPSYHEGMSNVLLEAAACARPIVTCDIHGCMEAVSDGVSGFLCKPQNTESLYTALEKLLLLSHEEKVRFGAQGRKHIETTFDKKKVVQDTLKGLGL